MNLKSCIFFSTVFYVKYSKKTDKKEVMQSELEKRPIFETVAAAITLRRYSSSQDFLKTIFAIF